MDAPLHHWLFKGKISIPCSFKSNVLGFSVLEESAKMIGMCTWQLVVGASILSPKPLHFSMGKDFCQRANIVNIFAISFGYGYGGVAIALVRTILIRDPFNIASKVGSKKGKKKMIRLICLILLLMSSGTFYIWTNVSRIATGIIFFVSFQQ